tara:strand:+ start:230 stop:430 length:201 start_codon:yes stop_codon:yes gene_type:complete
MPKNFFEGFVPYEGDDLIERVIHNIDWKLASLKNDNMTPEDIIQGLLDAREHLVKALEILNEGGDY